MAREHLDVAATDREAVIGVMSYNVRYNGFEVARQPVKVGDQWIGEIQRVAREPITQAVRPLPEVAACLGLRRIEGPAGVIWSGVIMEGDDASA